MKRPDGSSYEGQFEKGKREGFGKFYTKGFKYEGTWRGRKKKFQGKKIH